MKIKKSAISLIVLALISIILITGSPFQISDDLVKNNGHLYIKNIGQEVYAQDDGGGDGDGGDDGGGDSDGGDSDDSGDEESDDSGDEGSDEGGEEESNEEEEQEKDDLDTGEGNDLNVINNDYDEEHSEDEDPANHEELSGAEEAIKTLSEDKEEDDLDRYMQSKMEAQKADNKEIIVITDEEATTKKIEELAKEAKGNNVQDSPVQIPYTKEPEFDASPWKVVKKEKPENPALSKSLLDEDFEFDELGDLNIDKEDIDNACKDGKNKKQCDKLYETYERQVGKPTRENMEAIEKQECKNSNGKWKNDKCSFKNSQDKVDFEHELADLGLWEKYEKRNK